MGYQRAKAVKKAADAGKILRKEGKKPKRPSRTPRSRTDKMQELFESDMSEKKQRRIAPGGGKKSSFKSKSWYKAKMGTSSRHSNWPATFFCGGKFELS